MPAGCWSPAARPAASPRPSNTPRAGVAFAVEVLLGLSAPAEPTPVLLAAVVATAISRGFYGDHALLPCGPPVMPSRASGLAQVRRPALLAVAFDASATHGRRPLASGQTGAAPDVLLGRLACGVIGAGWPEVMGLGYGTARAAIDDAGR